MKKDISVIIPVLNEGEKINTAIEGLFAHVSGDRIEIIVVDGHPDGTTISQIRNIDVIRIISPAGRGIQMNAGAQKASGEVLLFLHCDTILPDDAFTVVYEAMALADVKAGAFDLLIDSQKSVFRLIEITASFRSRITRIPYGDQAIFIRRSFFFKIGQYAPIPIMEDVDLMRRVKKNKGRIFISEQRVVTSARRWEKEGVVYGTLRNWTLLTLFFLGKKPQHLVQFYKS